MWMLVRKTNKHPLDSLLLPSSAGHVPALLLLKKISPYISKIGYNQVSRWRETGGKAEETLQ